MRRWMLGGLAVAALLGTVAVWRAPPPDPVGGGVRVLRDGAEVELSGPLAGTMIEPLRSALTQGAHLVQLDSAGGPATAAQALADLVRAAKVDTAVTDRCLSACVAVFMAGTQRWIGPFAQLGLEARYAGSGLGPLYRRAGLPAEALAAALETPDGQGWFPDQAQLLDSRMATGVSAPDQFALAGFGPTPTQASVKARLLSIPAYRAVAEADPAGFDADLVAWTDAVLRGQPGTDAFARMRARLAALP